MAHRRGGRVKSVSRRPRERRANGCHHDTPNLHVTCASSEQLFQRYPGFEQLMECTQQCPNEWPSSRTHNLFALLEAIAQVPDKIHKGEASDGDGTPWEWSPFPYFSLIWPDHFQPGEICRRCSDEREVTLSRRLYLRIKDLEAQLIAKRVMILSRWKVQFIILSLEKYIDDSDKQIAIDDAAAYIQVKLDFHIPAISFLLKYNAREIYERVVHGEIEDLPPAQLWPGVAKEFENGSQRWSYWGPRLEELAGGKEGRS